MRINFVLIDSENVKIEHIEKLKHEHFRVVVFGSKHSKRLDFLTVNAIHSLGTNSYIEISGHGPSALDFHIAYYIGKWSELHPGAHFHIISKDKGFDPLIQHLRKQNVLCSRSGSVLEIPLVRSNRKLQPKQRAADFNKKILAPSKSRPATVKTLQSAINAYFQKSLSEEEVSDVLKALITSGYVSVKETKVTYCGK